MDMSLVCLARPNAEPASYALRKQEEYHLSQSFLSHFSRTTSRSSNLSGAVHNCSVQGYLPQAKSSGIERYRSELSTSKPVNLLPNRHSTRLHTTVAAAATQPSPQLQPGLNCVATSLVQMRRRQKRSARPCCPILPRPFPPKLARAKHHKLALPTSNTTITGPALPFRDCCHQTWTAWSHCQRQRCSSPVILLPDLHPHPC